MFATNLQDVGVTLFRAVEDKTVVQVDQTAAESELLRQKLDVD